MQDSGPINEHCYAVIMAGGSGSRLWPLSRKNRPKQFQHLVGDGSTLQHMYALLAGLYAPERIFVSTSEEHAARVREQLPQLSHGNIIIEPSAKDTGPAVCLAAAKLLARDPHAFIATYCADHVVGDLERFKATLTAAHQTVQTYPMRTILVGITPTRAHIGLGYIAEGHTIDTVGGYEIKEVRDFVEKPEVALAQKLLQRGGYLWNTAYRVFSARDFLSVVERVAPDIRAACAEPTLFKHLNRISFENLFKDHLEYLVIKGDFSWNDIGDWKAIYEAFMKDAERSKRTPHHITLDSTNAMIIGSERLVSVFGVNDVIVVDTKDAVLVVDRNQARNIKKLIEHIEREGLGEYL